ncbi:dioxygenase [Jannaschia sp. 2305UL9-9]|uniref:dioxygenase family protein n=1 Tax=Jannaschia sp. 2305UL9-9 TaxID=3121638 RepID=UPI0035280EA8
MQLVTQDNITDVVTEALGRNGPISDRQREILSGLIRHFHDFCREVKLQHDEFLYACDFLARAGQTCDGKRQEFILLADILGIEVLVDMLTNPADGGETESTVLGPFYRENPPVLPKGASTILKHYDNEETVYFEGRVLDTNGAPIEGATIDIWEDAPNGLYENHDHDQPDYNLRGRFETDADGHYAFVAVRPVPYPIPDDVTAGELLRAMGHHPNRPGHIHFIVSKPGYGTLVSQVFDADSDWLDNDSVFAVKESLVAKFAPTNEHETDLHCSFDFKLREGGLDEKDLLESIGSIEAA